MDVIVLGNFIVVVLDTFQEVFVIGMFRELEEAVLVRKQAELKYLGKVLDV